LLFIYFDGWAAANRVMVAVDIIDGVNRWSECIVEHSMERKGRCLRSVVELTQRLCSWRYSV